MASAELINAIENQSVDHKPRPSVVPENRLRSDSVLLYGTLSMLLFAPLAFGAVESWAIFVLSLGATALFVLWAWRQVSSGHLCVIGNPLYPPMLTFGIVLGLQLALRTSVYEYASLTGSMLFCIYALLAFLASQFLQRTSQVKVWAGLLSAYGAAVAIFAMLQSLSSNGKLYWVRTPRTGGWIYGPYVSHNHYAGLMEMLFPIAMVIALNRSVRGHWKWAAASAAALMAGTIFLSGSRGGMLAFFVQMVVLGTVLRLKTNHTRVWIAGGILVVIAGLILWVGGQGLVDRILSIHSETRVELDNGLRLRIDRDALRMFAARPILGWGLGTFPAVYPQYRSFYTDKFVNHAHNDYLQFLVETGLLGFSAALWFVLTLYRTALSKLNDWQEDLNGAVALAAMLGCTGILVHSFLDSNLQVPANAAWFYVLAAVATAPTRFGTHRARRHRRHHDRTEFDSSEACFRPIAAK